MAPSSSEAKNRPPRKPLPSETMDATALSSSTIASSPSGRSMMPARCSAPCPDDITCGVMHAHRPTTRPPSAGRNARATPHLTNKDSQAPTPRMMAMPSSAPSSPSAAASVRSWPEIAMISALKMFKGVEVNCCDTSRPTSAATDQHPQVAAPQAESLPDEGGDAAGELGIARFQADRCTDPARPHRLRRDNQAAAQRHAPAVKRVGFDRVDFARRPAMRNQDTGKSQAESAEHRDEDRYARIEVRLRGQPLARAEPEQNDVQQIDQCRHGRHHQPAER